MESNIVTINPERLARLMDPQNHLRRGAGIGVNGTFNACAMQAAHWLAGGDGSSDAPECVAPLIARYVIRLNDAVPFKAWRDELKPFLPRLLNTVNPALERRRAYLSVDWVVRWCAPLAFDVAAESLAVKWPDRAASLREHAATMRALPEVTDAASAKNARTAAAYAAAAAARAAYAAAAAARAAYAAKTKRAVWDGALDLLDRLIRVEVAR